MAREWAPYSRNGRSSKLASKAAKADGINNIDGSNPTLWSRGLRLLEIALAFVRFDHVASRIMNANHGIM